MRSIALIILLIFPILSTVAQEVRPFPMEEKALLWEIKGDGVKKSYLYGTMHLIEKDYFSYSKKLQKVLEKSDLLVLEIGESPNPLEDAQLLMLKEGELFDFFTEEQTDSLVQWVEKETGLNEEVFRATFSQMKPFAVVQMILQMQFVGKTESYELSFRKTATASDIPLAGLETAADQLAIFDNLSDEDQVNMVMETLRNPGEGKEVLRKMQELYQLQDVDSLYQLITEDSDVIAEEQNALLDARNKRWIPQIEDHIAAGKTFIAVGAGHLGGPNGVIRLLEKRGYTLIPVKL